MDPAPYGFDAAEHEPGVEISYSDGQPASNRMSYWSWKLSGMDLPHALVNLRAMRRADVIWTVLEWEWLAASFLQWIGLLQPKPIVANNVFLAENIARAGWFKRHLWARLMTEQTYLTLHARPALEVTRRSFPDKHFQLVLFGISTRAFPVTPPRLTNDQARPIRVYSIGDDPGRDWDTMLRAFGNDPQFEIRIICRWITPEMTARYSNLHVLKDVTVEDQRASYEWADFVILPMKDNVYSGITVLCEAAAMGKAVVVSSTGGADTYFDGNEVFYVPVGDSVAMRDTVVNATPAERVVRARAAQARFLRDDYTATGMARRHIAISRALLARTED